jgi:hypothetical protein
MSPTPRCRGSQPADPAHPQGLGADPAHPQGWSAVDPAHPQGWSVPTRRIRRAERCRCGRRSVERDARRLSRPRAADPHLAVPVPWSAGPTAGREQDAGRLSTRRRWGMLSRRRPVTPPPIPAAVPVTRIRKASHQVVATDDGDSDRRYFPMVGRRDRDPRRGTPQATAWAAPLRTRRVDTRTPADAPGRHPPALRTSRVDTLQPCGQAGSAKKGEGAVQARATSSA